MISNIFSVINIIIRTPFFLALVFIAFDIVSGHIAHAYIGDWQSCLAKKGLYHKLAFVAFMMLGYLFQYVLSVVDLSSVGVSVNLGSAPIGTCVCAYIIWMELGSIIENICLTNPDLAPAQIKHILGITND